MITGSVGDNNEAVVTLVVQNGSGQTVRVEAIIDTGFSGCLMIPMRHIELLDLEADGIREAMLADGQIAVFETYAASVLWDGDLVEIEALATTDAALVGMELLAEFRLRIDVIPNGAVTIERLRAPA